QGIAQFIPGTWATHGIDGNGDGKRDVWDPADAIPSAASYDCEIAGYVKKVPGDPTSNMLAAYNAGAYAVIKYGGVPPYK
ncbi:lytic transglycosylase domain-containing protein, partial [Streptomyces sp. SID8455]|nr:lytic transglycosylase domain-containing protein [Streptomyces sp. SID8455]